MRDFDVIIVMPYPFADHPSFPEGILKRSLEADGFRTGVIETPLWSKPESFGIMGRPRLFFAVISGPVDSLVLNYTSSRRRRREDLYQFGGHSFFPHTGPSIQNKIRPDRTILVFSNRIREMFKGVPIIIGGIEASLRRFAHYDFIQDQIRRSILLDSRADILVFGAGEKQLVEIARRMRRGEAGADIDIPGIARVQSVSPSLEGYAKIPSYEEITGNWRKLLQCHRVMESARLEGKGIFQQHADRWVVQNPPAAYSSHELDDIYGAGFSRRHPYHRLYSPALEMNLFSVTSHRGCLGNCRFCAVSGHEGKRVISRSPDSIISEMSSLKNHPRWRGVISNIGGATAEMYGMDRRSGGAGTPGQVFLELLREARSVKGVRKIFLGSGIRHDWMVRHPELLEEIMQFHAGRFLRVAPEHTEDHVLKLMKKPSFRVFEEFLRLFRSINRGLRLRVELAAYWIVGHPGETVRDVAAMKARISSLGLPSTDVQIFTPAPGTLSTAMFASELGPEEEKIPVEKNIKILAGRKETITGR